MVAGRYWRVDAPEAADQVIRDRSAQAQEQGGSAGEPSAAASGSPSLEMLYRLRP